MKTQLKPLLLTFFLLLCVLDSQALVCPDHGQAPLCPNSGTTLLDDTYPTQAFVISSNTLKNSPQSAKVTSQYIGKIAKSYSYEKLPQVLVTVQTKSEFDQIIKELKDVFEKAGLKPDQIDSILKQVTHVEAPSYTWQQDYFESFIDLKTGAPVLREFESYLSEKAPQLSSNVQKMENAAIGCQLKKGIKFPSLLTDNSVANFPPGESFGSGEMGGNTEGAPGGLCLKGDNQSNVLAEDYCGNKENVITLQTSWLNVGHVDEIFKIIPSQFSDGRPKECQFSLMAASPKKALELMESGVNKSNAFLSLPSKLTPEELELSKKNPRSWSRYRTFGTRDICKAIFAGLRDGSYVPLKKNLYKNKLNKSVFLDFFMSKAYARAEIEGDLPEDFKCDDYIDEIPNEFMSDLMKRDETLKKLNQAIQESIDKDKQKIKQKILSRLPQCLPYFDILDVPDLFYGSAPIEKNGQLELPRPSDINSFLPNPTNSVVMNRSLLVSESGNNVFDYYLEEQLKKRKITMEKIDTWDYAHRGYGNIHCSSHSIPYCKPRP
ncbi:MAG: hypothetical protein KBD76_05185 [Bacteriovorax sp.]|jgi:hypothetical protein|nr:hypothetical protein [Bacteriovorax sp.]